MPRLTSCGESKVIHRCIQFDPDPHAITVFFSGRQRGQENQTLMLCVDSTGDWCDPMVGDPCETRMTDEAISRPADDRVRAGSNALERRWRSRATCVSDQRKGRAGLNYRLFRGTLRLNHCRR